MSQDNGPIEIVLDVRKFQDVRVRTPGGNPKEFFDGNDAGFVAHRGNIQRSLVAVAQKLRASNAGRVGFMRVRMREEALAKSHRPVTSLFQPNITPTIGSSGVGELIVQVTPFTIERALAQTAKAEDRVGYKPHKTKPGVMVPDPSRIRSEVGAIESLNLWSPADRRGFDARAAVHWFESRAVPRAYRVDLFDAQRPAQAQAEVDFASAGDPVADLQRKIDEELGCGYVTTLFRPDTKSMMRMYIWLIADPSIRHMVAPTHLHRVLEQAVETTLDINAHKALLSTLEMHPAVRRISLPPNLRRDATSGSTASAAARESVRRRYQFAKPLDGAQYPVVGVIDGGVTQVPSEWIIHKSDYLRPAHADKSHGTEISSLLVAGQRLNGDAICPEPDGCWLADMALIPRVDKFDQYYRSELDLVRQIEVEVQDAKVAANARVFSFSHNFEEPPGGTPTYTELSHGLDRISRENDVVFVVSAGNAIGAKGRREWTNNQVAVLSNLASCSGDRIAAPADSVLNVAVGAINPPNIAGAIAGAPARYSRRGPGFMQLVKPDVAHYGGVCGSTSTRSGLQSVSETGTVKDVHGTSYSAPLVAKAIARYDQITLGALPREALIALLIHSAKVPACLGSFDRSEIVRNLVGFGVPINAQKMIEGSPHAATLLFHDRMMPKKDLFFGFDWPRSLVANGKCRGHAMLTLVYTPPIADAFESELVRVNFEASLQRRNPKTGKFEKKCTDTFSVGGSTSSGAMEKELMEDGLKWGVVKQSQYRSVRGAGSSSDWQIALKYLLRTEELFPEDGVPFAMILTISDPDNSLPVYQDMKIGLSARDVLTGDIRQPSGRVQPRGGRSGA